MRRPMHYKPAGRSGWDCRAFDAESKKHNRALYEAYGDEQAEALIADAAAEEQRTLEELGTLAAD